MKTLPIIEKEIVQGIHLSSCQDDYRVILTRYGVIYTESDFYLLVRNGEPFHESDLIQISIIQSEISIVLEELIPKLSVYNLNYKLICNRQAAKLILDGGMGIDNIGKIISIYLPKNHSEFISILNLLIEATRSFKGPLIANHYNIGGLVYLPDVLENHISSYTRKTFKQKYIVYSTLKRAIKGDVLKAIYWKSLLIFKQVLIKEGRSCMFSDSVGRDMKNRLDWQMKVQSDLAEVIKLPQVVEIFQDAGNSYLVMDFIKGQTLDKVADEIRGHRDWSQLSKRQRIAILKILIDVLDSVQKMHDKGFVHRDLTPSNFLLSSRNEIYTLDFELAFSIPTEYPTPAFEFGTFGYISPQQLRMEKPTKKDDIFSLGGLMIRLLIGLQPLKFDLSDANHVRQSLNFFMHDVELTTLISRCLSQSPELRPTTDALIESLRLVFIRQQSLQYRQDLRKLEAPTNDEISRLTNLAINGLMVSESTHGDFFYHINKNSLVSHPSSANSEFGLMSPITSILYILDTVSTDNYSQHVHNCFRIYMINNIDSILQHTHYSFGRLFNGDAGLAITISLALATKILPRSLALEGLIERCLSRDVPKIDVAEGIAGQGLAALFIYHKDQSEFLRSRIISFAEIITRKQFPDGSWPVYDSNDSEAILTGLERGVAGIIFFLIQFDKVIQNDFAGYHINNGLKWLEKKSKSKIAKNRSNYDHEVEDKSLISGIAGIALVFLLAYEKYNKEQYKDIAENLIRDYSSNVIHDNFTLATGMAGLGVLYATAARICGTAEWESGLYWIYHVLANTYHTKDRNAICWSTNGSWEFNERLFDGTPGIIYFLTLVKEYVNTLSPKL